MNKLMIIESNGESHLFICPACGTPAYGYNEVGEDIIPTFCSSEEAERAGWRVTNNIQFCQPGYDYVWVCPDCWPGDAMKQ